jgi:hypothetical protein
VIYADPTGNRNLDGQFPVTIKPADQTGQSDLSVRAVGARSFPGHQYWFFVYFLTTSWISRLASVMSLKFAPTGVVQMPLILFRTVEPVYVRVNVDGNEAWRVGAKTAAIGYLRGNKEISTPLQFVRFEPYVLPKTSLTGDSTERADTRVLQVVYSFRRGNLPMHVGQQMDVYIDSPAYAVTAGVDAAR